MQVSNAQHQAITHGAGPAIVLAGPGSGKTLVITQRVRYLIEAYHVRPQEILVITFTKAAAQEMQSRFQALSRQRGGLFSYFKICLSLQRGEYSDGGEEIPDSAAPALRVRTSF